MGRVYSRVAKVVRGQHGQASERQEIKNLVNGGLPLCRSRRTKRKTVYEGSRRVEQGGKNGKKNPLTIGGWAVSFTERRLISLELVGGSTSLCEDILAQPS
jgi:hypothetical protein